MPVYEYVCPVHGYIEAWRPMSECGQVLFCNLTNPEDSSKICGNGCERVYFTAPSMQPDTYWSGKVDSDVGYVTSRSELQRKLSSAGLRHKEPGSDKDAERKADERVKKADETLKSKIRNWITDHDLKDLQRMIKNETKIPTRVDSEMRISGSGEPETPIVERTARNKKEWEVIRRES